MSPLCIFFLIFEWHVCHCSSSLLYSSLSMNVFSTPENEDWRFDHNFLWHGMFSRRHTHKRTKLQMLQISKQRFPKWQFLINTLTFLKTLAYIVYSCSIGLHQLVRRLVCISYLNVF